MRVLVLAWLTLLAATATGLAQEGAEQGQEKTDKEQVSGSAGAVGQTPAAAGIAISDEERRQTSRSRKRAPPNSCECGVGVSLGTLIPPTQWRFHGSVIRS